MFYFFFRGFYSHFFNSGSASLRLSCEMGGPCSMFAQENEQVMIVIKKCSHKSVEIFLFR